MANNCLKFCFLLFFSSLRLFSVNSEQFEDYQVRIQDLSLGRLAPALYVFGDSLVDCGNNNNLPTRAKSNFLPYGVDFNGKPTGRFTNGKTSADYIALLLGLPLAPPYLGLSESQRINITTGMNYASGSCGILPETGTVAGTCLSLDNQTDLFQRFVENDLPNHIKKQPRLTKHLSKSLFFISMGSNDYVLNYLLSTKGIKERLFPEAFAQFLADELSKRLQRLYMLGARKFLVNDIGPVGCIPAMRHKGECDEKLNQIVIFFSRKLPGMLQQLQSHLPGTVFTQSDNFKFHLQMMASPERYGITDTRNPCCVDGGHGTLPCLPNIAPCKNRNSHLYFDAFHPSQVTNFIFARRCFSESSICSPLNVKQLVAA